MKKMQSWTLPELVPRFAEKIVIIPLRSKDVSGKLVASDQGKEDHVFQNSEKNVSGKKKKSKKFSQKMIKQSSMKRCSKKFHCNDCGGSFSELQRHINAVHLKIKPYECEHCQKSFGNLAKIFLIPIKFPIKQKLLPE